MPAPLPSTHSARHLAALPDNAVATPTDPDDLAERVALESQALVLTSIRRAAHMLDHGTPDTQLKVIGMFAKPAIDRAMGTDEADTQIINVFHQVREMMANPQSDKIVDVSTVTAPSTAELDA